MQHDTIERQRWVLGRTLTLAPGVVPDPVTIIQDRDPVHAVVDGDKVVLQYSTPGWTQMSPSRRHFVKAWLITWLGGLGCYLALSVLTVLIPGEPFAPHLVFMMVGLAVLSTLLNLAFCWRPRRVTTLSDADLADTLRFLITATGTGTWGDVDTLARQQHWSLWISATLRRWHMDVQPGVEGIETDEQGRTHSVLSPEPGEGDAEEVSEQIAEDLRNSRMAATWPEATPTDQQ